MAGATRSESSRPPTRHAGTAPRQFIKTAPGHHDQPATPEGNQAVCAPQKNAAEPARDCARPEQSPLPPPTGSSEHLKEEAIGPVRRGVPVEGGAPRASAPAMAADAAAGEFPALSASVLENGTAPAAQPEPEQDPEPTRESTTAGAIEQSNAARPAADSPAVAPLPAVVAPLAAGHPSTAPQNDSAGRSSAALAVALPGAAETADRAAHASSASRPASQDREKGPRDVASAPAGDRGPSNPGTGSPGFAERVPAARPAAEPTRAGTIHASSAASPLNGRQPALAFAARLTPAGRLADNVTAAGTGLPEKHLALPAEVLLATPQQADAAGIESSRPDQTTPVPPTVPEPAAAQPAPIPVTAPEPAAAQPATDALARTPEPAASAAAASAVEAPRQRATSDVSNRPAQPESPPAPEGTAGTLQGAGTGIIPVSRAEHGRPLMDPKPATEPGLLETGPSPADSRLRLETSHAVLRAASVNGLSFVVRGRAEQGGPASQVEVRVTGRTGELQVAVRTADERLGEALRDASGDLIARLSGHGYRAERLNSVDAAPAAQASRAPHGAGPAAQETPGGFGDSSNAGQGSAGRQARHGHGRREQGDTPWTSIFETARASAPSPDTPDDGAAGIAAHSFRRTS